MADPQKSYEQSAEHDEDVKTLHSMGYAQELARRMGGFQNFAISFSIICILAGGITAFPLSLSAAGGASVGYGWPLACLFAILVAAAMGQIASAYPTAGGIYHWASLLGGRGYGWVAAWFNLLGLLFVVASVNFGVFLLFRDLVLREVLGLDINALGWVTAAPLDQGWWTQTLFVAAITLTQAWLNHMGIRATTILTDSSGYLIFAVAVLLTLGLLFYAPSLNFSRLFTFTNFSGPPGGGVWPTAIQSVGFVFLLGLLQGVYTITGFDASAHTAEETRDAARAAPRGMLHAVFWSFVFGYVMLCAFVLALPSVEEGAKQGWNAFPWLMQQSGMPKILKDVLIIGIVIANYLCALAGLTSTSRMMYAFARDGGLPFSKALKHVSPKHRTPVNAIWWAAILCIVATLYGDAFVVLFNGMRGVPLRLVRDADRRGAPGRDEGQLDEEGSVHARRRLEAGERVRDHRLRAADLRRRPAAQREGRLPDRRHARRHARHLDRVRVPALPGAAHRRHDLQAPGRDRGHGEGGRRRGLNACRRPAARTVFEVQA